MALCLLPVLPASVPHQIIRVEVVPLKSPPTVTTHFPRMHSQTLAHVSYFFWGQKTFICKGTTIPADPFVGFVFGIYMYTSKFCFCERQFVWLYSRLQIGWHRILKLFLKTFNLVPGVAGFPWDVSLVPWYSVVFIVNPMGNVLVRWIVFRNDLKILCCFVCNRLYILYVYMYVRSR